MTSKRFIISLVLIFILSLTAWGIWIWEILYRPGWEGLNWLFVTLYSPYISLLIAAIACSVPFIGREQTVTTNILFSVLFFYIINLICFEAGKFVNFNIYRRWFISGSEALILSSIVVLIFPFLVLMYWMVIHKLLKKNKESNMPIILLFSLATFPLSNITIHINSGFGTGTNWVDIVKMGYPIFWMSFLMGTSSLMIAKQKELTSW
ncbi:MAG: hypothetical protein K0S32_277 [Bacteroidetes bacterium]|jgi:hypothetical protein|nr:hypothetical protein [Bacteroidota bacterium]